MRFTDDAWTNLTGNLDAESLNGRLLFAIPKKGGSKSLASRQRRLILYNRQGDCMIPV